MNDRKVVASGHCGAAGKLFLLGSGVDRLIARLMLRKASLIFCAVSLLWPSCAMAECYDVAIVAHATDQVPSEIGDCGEGCIIMSWPWFVDLEIGRVTDGSLTTRTVRVLAIQHTYNVSGEREWFLRKNDVGSYNLLSPEEGFRAFRCFKGAPPAKSYLRPGEGRTLEDLHDEGLLRYGHYPRRDP